MSATFFLFFSSDSHALWATLNLFEVDHNIYLLLFSGQVKLNEGYKSPAGLGLGPIVARNIKVSSVNGN